MQKQLKCSTHVQGCTLRLFLVIPGLFVVRTKRKRSYGFSIIGEVNVLCVTGGSMHASIKKPFFIQFHAVFFAKNWQNVEPPPGSRRFYRKPRSATSIRSLLNLRSHCSLLRIRGWGPKTEPWCHFSRQTKWSLRLPSIKLFRVYPQRAAASRLY